MKVLRTLGLSSCCGFLLVIGWQLETANSLVAAAPSFKTPAYTADRTVSAGRDPALGQAWLKTAVERPLMRETRRPDTADKPESVKHPLRLAGIITGPSGKRAIFMPEQGRPVSLAEGEHLGSMLVRSIGANEVAVETETGFYTINPRFTSR